MKLTIFRKKKPQKKKTALIEWRDSIVFAVVVATLFRWSFVEAFVVPTSSMENTILVGDYLFVSKFHYGPRTPRTPLQIPLTHQKIWGTEIPSYLEWIELPSYRLPGLRNVERGEPVVFNIPPKKLSDGIERPIDLKTYYVKRCVAIPGDVFEIKDKQIIVNGQPLMNPTNMKFSYFVTAREEINPRHFEKLNLTTENYYRAGHTEDQRVIYRMFLTEKQREEMRKLPFIVSVAPDTSASDHPNAAIFPESKSNSWNEDNYGPLVIPAKGMKMMVNDSMLNVYGEIIKLYEGHEDVVMDEGSLRVDGKQVDVYTFTQDYYFMMGDNRHNSLDSRFWGFVPEDHILGKPLFIWMSVNSEADFFNKVRWNRIFTKIE